VKSIYGKFNHIFKWRPITKKYFYSFPSKNKDNCNFVSPTAKIAGWIKSIQKKRLIHGSTADKTTIWNNWQLVWAE
jgi:hypothetical protein